MNYNKIYYKLRKNIIIKKNLQTKILNLSKQFFCKNIPVLYFSIFKIKIKYYYNYFLYNQINPTPLPILPFIHTRQIKKLKKVKFLFKK